MAGIRLAPRRRLPKPKVAGSRPVSRSAKSLLISEEAFRTLDQLGPASHLLQAVERGDESETQRWATFIAHEVLSSPIVTLAHAVLAGGPHTTARAIELAERLVLENGSPALARGDAGGRP